MMHTTNAIVALESAYGSQPQCISVLVHETLELRMLFMNQYFSFLRWNATEVAEWKNKENVRRAISQTETTIHEQHDEEK